MNIRTFSFVLQLIIIAAVSFIACNPYVANAQFSGHVFPQPVGVVNDFEHLFSKSEVDTLTEIINSNQKATTNQIAIVVTNDPVITRDNLKDYVTALHNKWGVGTKQKNNGVVICIVPSLRILRISNGYGIGDKLSDAETASIISDVIVPEFKKGHYYLGVKKGLISVINKIK